jgi:hypothetical protein
LRHRTLFYLKNEFAIMTVATSLLIALTILLGLVLAFVVKRFIKPDAGDNFLAALVFAPTILMIAATSIKFNLEMLGFKASIERAADKKAYEVTGDLKKLAIFSLTDNDPNFALAAYFEACADYFVIRPSKIPTDAVELNKYVVDVTYAVRSSIACGKLQGVVILDDASHYLGMFDPEFFFESLSIWAVPTSGEPIPFADLASRIETFTIFGASLKYPIQRIQAGEGYTNSIDENSSLRAAFEVFRESKAQSLPLVDSDRRFKGMLSYRTVIDAFLAGIFAQ